jgi:hypothetical protein
MTEITKEMLEEFIRANKFECYATQTNLCVPVINRIYKKMKAGIKLPAIKVAANLICDGHHRYIASIFAHFPLEQIPTQVTAATNIIEWELIVFQEEDWDTPAKIMILNAEDAYYNNIEIELIEALLK